MSLSKTWYTSANLAWADTSTILRANASILFALKGLLTQVLTGTAGTGGQPPASAAWTVDSSSDGTTAGAGDNLGGGTFTAAKWVRAAAGVAHTWFVLKSPASAGILDGPWYMMVSFGTGSDSNIIVGISKNAPTGGTTTADPTSSPAQSLFTTFAALPGVAAAGKSHIVMDAKGSFRYHYSLNGSNRFCGFWNLEELVETKANDSARIVFIIDMLNSGTGAPRFGTTNLGGGYRGYANDGVTPLTSSTGRVMNIQWNGNTDASTRTTVNATDSKADGLPVAYLYDVTAAHLGMRGRVPDVWYMGGQVAVGAGSPSGAAPDRVLAGDILTPFSVTPSL